MTALGLEDLIQSMAGPLRTLREAEAARRSRIHLPVGAWRERLEEIGRNVERDSGLASSLALLASRLEALEGGGADEGAIDEALALIGELATAERSPRRVAPDPRAAGGSEREAPRADELEAALAALRAPLTRVAGVGERRAEELGRFGLETVEDLLYHLPFRYDDRRERRAIRQLRVGDRATLVARVEQVEERRVGRGRRALLSALARDDTGSLELVWYHQIRWFRSRLRPGSRWLIHGRIEAGYTGRLRIVHPELEPAEEAEEGGEILPVYEKPTRLSVAAMRRIVAAAVRDFAALVPDVLPGPLRSRLGLLPLGEALRAVHAPAPEADLASLEAARSEGHRAIVFDELFFVQLGLLRRKGQVAREPGISFAGPGDLARRMLARLPFELTAAQRRVLAEIERDMCAPHPMHRLLQGDVGTGKTVVAVAAALRAVECGYQAVLMAPTELLAEQHWRTVGTALSGLGVPAWLLRGEGSAAERREALSRLAAGEPGLAVGTHALIQEGVELPALGLAIIDEQHRFGVMQRAVLGRGRRPQAPAPDVLLMTATPIPRTLALSVFGDLDLSTLDERPPGRQPVETRLYSVGERRRAYERVRRELRRGRQAFVVFPLVEESERSDLRDATSAARELGEVVFPEHRVALVHGRMPAAEREAVMRAFQAGEHALLVATTVIEVGIDVPGATAIVIEHAERFGLSQLHQLRGRVGRGREPSCCLLIADYAQSREARERLRVMTETEDGLRIAEADLAIRGPGSMLGTRQSGLPDFRVANLLRDAAVLREARAAAAELLARDPDLSTPEGAALRRVLEARWAGRLGLARVG